MDGRVNGSLNLSRAIGDMEYKQTSHLSAAEQAVTANPDVRELQLGPSYEFMILACDGIWDVLSNQQVWLRHCACGGCFCFPNPFVSGQPLLIS